MSEATVREAIAIAGDRFESSELQPLAAELERVVPPQLGHGRGHGPRAFRAVPGQRGRVADQCAVVARDIDGRDTAGEPVQIDAPDPDLVRGIETVGFRERRSSYIAQMNECHVLPEAISKLIPEMKALVEKLSVRERVPQIELAVGEQATALVFRHLAPLTEDDRELLKKFSQTSAIHVWLQPGGPETAHPLHPAASELYYELPDFGVRIGFRPTDFTQVNQAVNRALVARAVRLLDPQPGERVADLFCGLGNFSLPLAKRGAQVVGFEANRELVERARQNAAANGLVAQFEAMDLSRPSLEPYAPFEKILLDPPREGAVQIVSPCQPRGRGASSTYRATRQRSRAMPASSCTRRGSGSLPRASSTCSRTPRMSKASPSSTCPVTVAIEVNGGVRTTASIALAVRAA